MFNARMVRNGNFIKSVGVYHSPEYCLLTSGSRLVLKKMFFSRCVELEFKSPGSKY